MANKKINKIIAITEILKEFMWRLMHQNFKITDEELMQNAELLKNLFCVKDMQIDKKWSQFFRNNFKQSNPIGKTIKNEFDVRNILKHVEHVLDPKVVTLFNIHLQIQPDNVILTCTEMSEKQKLARKQTRHKRSESDKETLLKDMFSRAPDRIDDFKEIQQTMTDTIKKEPQELNIKEEIEDEEYTINVNASEILKDMFSRAPNKINDFKEIQETLADKIKKEPQELNIKEEIEVGEYTINVNANDMLKEPQALRIMEENEVEEFITNDNSNEFIEIYAVIDEDSDDDDENLMDGDKYTEKTLSRVDVPESRIDQKYCKIQDNTNSKNTAKDTENYKYVQKLTFDPIKKEPIEMNSNEHIKEEEKEFEEPQAMHNFYIDPVAPKIKQDPNEINTDADKHYYRDREEFEELESQVMQSPKLNSHGDLMDIEIKQPGKTNTDSDNNENDIDQETCQETQTIKCLVQQKYIVPLEHEIKQEPVETILNIHHLSTSNENLSAQVDESVQYKDNKIDEAIEIIKPNEIIGSSESKHNDVTKISKHDDYLAGFFGKMFHLKLLLAMEGDQIIVLTSNNLCSQMLKLLLDWGLEELIPDFTG